jgi:hypothetical protein
MWRWKRIATAAAAVCLTGCAAIENRRLAQPGSGEVGRGEEMSLVGCLAAGAAPGTFVLTEVAGGRAVDVMSTRIGLTTYAGRRVAVRGQEQAAPERSIYEVKTVFRIRDLAVEGACN